MTSKIVRQRTEYLRGLRRGASERVRDIIQDVVDLYQDRKISNYSTAENLIKKLKSDNKRTVTFAIKEFEKNIDKWRGNEELRDRMRANVKKSFAINFITFTLAGEDKKGSGFIDDQGYKHKLLIAENQVVVKTSEGNNLSDLVNSYLIHNQYDDYIKALRFRLKRKDISKEEYNRRANIEAYKAERGIPDEPRKRRVRAKATETKNIFDSKRFKSVLQMLLKADKTFRRNFPQLEQYASAIKIMSVNELESFKGGRRPAEEEQNLRDTNQISIFHRNVTTKLDINANDFVEAIRNKKHTNGECWFNALRPL